MVLLQWPVLWLLRAFVDPDPVTGALASDYFAILIYGAPAVLGTYALSGWFLGMQNSRMLMVTSIVINLSNIAVSLLLVYGLGWKIPGVAVGTLVAQWLGFFTGLWLLRRYRLQRPQWRQVVKGDRLRRFFQGELGCDVANGLPDSRYGVVYKAGGGSRGCYPGGKHVAYAAFPVVLVYDGRVCICR